MKIRSIFDFALIYIMIATVISSSIIKGLIEKFGTFGSRWKKKN